MKGIALARQLWAFLKIVFGRFNEDEGSVLSGNIAYSLMLAIVPFLIFATALTGFLVGSQWAEMALSSLFAALPGHVAMTLEPVLFEVIGQRRGGILTVSALAAIWAASNGVEAIRIGLDRAYEVDDFRHVALNRIMSVAVVLIGFAVFVVLAILIIFAPLGFVLVERWTAINIPLEADFLRYVIAMLLLGVSLWAMHRLLPSRSMRGIRLWPGIVVSILIWGAAATLLSVYLAFAPSYAITYGTLAGVIVTLLFFYLTGVALIFGAEVNAALNRDRLTPVTEDEAKPEIEKRMGL